MPVSYSNHHLRCHQKYPLVHNKYLAISLLETETHGQRLCHKEKKMYFVKNNS